MAKEIKKIVYGCKFECGSWDENYNLVEQHEKECWDNPINKTCRTCKHEIYHAIEEGFRKYLIRKCKLNNITETEYLKLSKNIGINPKENCDKWELH